MRTPPSQNFLKFLHWSFTACVGLIFSAGLTHAQFETEPHPMDTFIKGITNFSESTGIRGILQYLEKDRETL